jgi:hypothetical protein
MTSEYFMKQETVRTNRVAEQERPDTAAAYIYIYSGKCGTTLKAVWRPNVTGVCLLAPETLKWRIAWHGRYFAQLFSCIGIFRANLMLKSE